MTSFPFKETVLSDWKDGKREVIREFPVDVDPGELIWHRDRERRHLTVLESVGWSFQHENQLPFDLTPGETIHIAPRSYHRVIKGTGPLVVHVQMYEESEK